MPRTGLKLSEEIIRIRVSKSQKEQFREAAKKEGMELSVWLRWLAVKAIKED